MENEWYYLCFFQSPSKTSRRPSNYGFGNGSAIVSGSGSHARNYGECADKLSGACDNGVRARTSEHSEPVCDDPGRKAGSDS